MFERYGAVASDDLDRGLLGGKAALNLGFVFRFDSAKFVDREVLRLSIDDGMAIRAKKDEVGGFVYA